MSLSPPFWSTFPVEYILTSGGRADPHRPPTSRTKLGELFGGMTFTNLQAFYCVLSGSVLEIFEEEFQTKSSGVYKKTMSEVLKVRLYGYCILQTDNSPNR